MSPLNLAVMSLERYIAICCPLKHVHIITSRTTGVAIAFIWTTGSLESLTNFLLFVSLKNTSFVVPHLCNRRNLFRLPIFSSINDAFTIAYFVIVSLIIIYTYVAILVIVKSASARAHNATKAGKTVLLHLIQLCLCLISTLFNMINYNSMWNIHPVVATHIQYTLFVSLIIFPKCLSPLIYGLRDQTLRQVLQSYIPFSFTATARTFASAWFDGGFEAKGKCSWQFPFYKSVSCVRSRSELEFWIIWALSVPEVLEWLMWSLWLSRLMLNSRRNKYNQPRCRLSDLPKKAFSVKFIIKDHNPA